MKHTETGPTQKSPKLVDVCGFSSGGGAVVLVPICNTNVPQVTVRCQHAVLRLRCSRVSAAPCLKSSGISLLLIRPSSTAFRVRGRTATATARRRGGEAPEELADDLEKRRHVFLLRKNTGKHVEDMCAHVPEQDSLCDFG